MAFQLNVIRPLESIRILHPPYIFETSSLPSIIATNLNNIILEIKTFSSFFLTCNYLAQEFYFVTYSWAWYWFLRKIFVRRSTNVEISIKLLIGSNNLANNTSNFSSSRKLADRWYLQWIYTFFHLWFSGINSFFFFFFHQQIITHKFKQHKKHYHQVQIHWEYLGKTYEIPN